MTEENKQEKVDEDFGNDLTELLGSLAKEIEQNPIKVEKEFKYPMEISGIKNNPPRNINTKETGSLVKIRPCSEKYKNKTYLGIYIGEVSIEAITGLYTKTNILNIMSLTNPAIFVPELKKVIFGCESWWGYIKSEEELKQITDNDIDNVWYVQLLKQMGKEDGLGKREQDNQND